MWLGLDDTDSLEEGCTTLEFYKLLQNLPCKYGQPRLVRLWPFASRRTRGNAALAVEIDCDVDIVEWLDKYWKDNLEPLKGKISKSHHSDRQQFPADPGMVLFESQPSEEVYWSTVRGEFGFTDGGWQWGGSGRIGATAACAWREHSVTWEGIAWRKNERIVSPDAIIEVDSWPETFLCRDPRTTRGLVAPRGTCPVMFGVRTDSRESCVKATKLLSEHEDTAPIIAWMVFSTNQTSGDHILESRTCVIETIELRKGGHVELNNSILSFHDGGDVNSIAQWLQLGDSIEYIGLEFDSMIHLEAIKVLESTKMERPICECGSRMKSMGKNQGLRCPSCKLVTADLWVKSTRKPPIEGWAQPPVDKRRHLARDWSKQP